MSHALDSTSYLKHQRTAKSETDVRIDQMDLHKQTNARPYRFPLQDILPESRSTIILSSGGLFLTTAARPSEQPSSWIPTKIAPGNSKQDINGSVKRGTYGAHSSNGNKRERSNSQASRTSDGRVDITTTCMAFVTDGSKCESCYSWCIA